MSGTSAIVLLRHIHRLTAEESLNHLSDRDLLQRFAARREEAAFEAILQRHGALVWGVCRRALFRRHDAEDAFQATFLTLADRVGSVRKPEALACWLHGVAYRIAVRMRDRNVRVPLPSEDLPAAVPDPLDEVTGRELCLALDEELSRLPWTCRTPLVLCYLEGRTRDEAAGRLGWSLSTLKRRLRQGCRLLRDRLSRRGLAPSALLAAALTCKGTAALPPATLRRKLVNAAAGRALNPPPSAPAAPLGRLFPARARVMLVLLAFIGLGVGGPGHRSGGPVLSRQSAAAPVPLTKPLLDHQGDPLPPGAIARLGSARWRHGGQIYGLAFSPDGKLVASGSFDGRVVLWDAATGREVRSLERATAGLYALAFSPDGKALAATCSGSEGGCTWDVATGKLKELAGFGEKVRALGYRRKDGVLLAATAKGKRPQVSEVIWDIQRRFRDMKGHEADVVFVGLTPDGKTLISADKTGTVRLSEVASGKELRLLRRLGREMSAGDVGLALSPDGKLLAVGTALHSLALWDVASGKRVRTLASGREWYTALAFSPDGRTLISGGNDGTLRRWDVASGKEQQPPPGHAGRVLASVLSPDGRTLISAGRDSTVRFWDVASGRETRRLSGKPTPRELARTLDPVTGKGIRQFEQTPWILCLALTPDGKTLAGGGSEGTVYVWDAHTGRELRRLKGHGRAFRKTTPQTETKPWSVLLTTRERLEVRALAFLPDGKTLVSGGEDGTLRLWDVRTDRERREWPAKQGEIIGVAVSPDGKTLASMGWDGTYMGVVNTIRFWDLEGWPLRRLNEAVDRATKVIPTGPRDQALALHVFAAAFSPDGRTLASLGFDGAIRTWDLPAARQLRRWGRNPAEPVPDGRGGPTWSMSAVEPLVFSPDGKTLAVSWGHSLVLYEVATGKLRRQWHGHRGPITSLSFSADGSRLASGSGDFTTLVWDVSGGQRRPVRLTPEELAAAWKQLAGDAAAAQEAVWKLAAASAQSVPLLKKRISPAAGVDGQRLQRLLSDLDSSRFATRQTATRELERLADEVEPDLKRFLVGKPALEARRRVEAILKDRAAGTLSGEQLRVLRAVEVLEHANTPAAQALLKSWAGGAPKARLTIDARAARARLPGLRR